jgi:hypothetical protein
MKKEELIRKARLLIKHVKVGYASTGGYAEAKEFLKNYGGGPNNSFYTTIEKLNLNSSGLHVEVKEILEGFINYVENDLFQGLSPERKAQLDVVSDFLEQAQILLENDEFHPATSAILIGASLEELLRNWIEAEGLEMGDKKPGINNYAQILKENKLINKQDIKDINAWAGIRNDAAHGKWEEVSDRARIKLMLEGVNLFMRKYIPSESKNSKPFEKLS